MESKHREKKGTIIVEFFRTEQYERRSRPPQVHTKRYEEHFVQDANKKSAFADTVRIKEGKEFQLPGTKNFQQNRFDRFGSGGGGHGGYHYPRDNRKRDGKYDDKRGGEMLVDYRVDYERVVDSITIHYADWSYLQLMNIVDIRKYEHLKLVPRSLMSSNDFITKVLWTIVRELKKVHYSDVNKEFEKATGNLISDYFEFKEDEMKTFLRMKRHVFVLDDKGNARAREDYDVNAMPEMAGKRKPAAKPAPGQKEAAGGVIVID